MLSWTASRTPVQPQEDRGAEKCKCGQIGCKARTEERLGKEKHQERDSYSDACINCTVREIRMPQPLYGQAGKPHLEGRFRQIGPTEAGRVEPVSVIDHLGTTWL